MNILTEGYCKGDTSETNVVWTKFARNPLGTLVGVLHLMLHNICLTQESEDELTVNPRAPYDKSKNRNLLLVRTQAAKVIFTCLFHVNNLKLHDVIVTNQQRVVLKITTQYDLEPKIDFK